PWGGPATVLKYLARYTHRAAISNHRLVALADGHVTFRWKDYAHGGRRGTMTLEAVEFVRRFLFHVLPAGFVRVRHYGLLANRHRREKLARGPDLPSVAPAPPTHPPPRGGRARAARAPGRRGGGDGAGGVSPVWRR